MKTDKFYLDETGCYTTDITKAKALISSKGVIVKPKCFVDNRLRIVSDISKAKAIVNAYKDDMLQVLLLQHGGAVKSRHIVEEMCAYMAGVISDCVGYRVEPLLPTNKTCLLANFMEETPLVTSCHTQTDIVDREGRIQKAGEIKFAPQSPQIRGVCRSVYVVPADGHRTKPNTGHKEAIKEDECVLRAHSYPAVLVRLQDFEAINEGVNFLRDYLYFCE